MKNPDHRDSVTENFTLFNPDEYLHEYYDVLGPENTFLLDFYHEFYAALPAFGGLLEIGGGPAIYPLISASSKASNIVFTDYHQPCRESVKKWMDGSPDSYNWDPYFEYVSSKERANSPSSTPEAVKQRLRSKINGIAFYDVLSILPCNYGDSSKLDIISSNFCAESITTVQPLFMKAIGNILALVRPGAHLVLTMLRSATSYRVGSSRFPAFPVDELLMERLLMQNGFRTLRIVVHKADKGREYPGIMAISAQRKDTQ